MSFFRRSAFLVTFMTLLPAASPAADVALPESFATPVARLEAAVKAELDGGLLNGVSVALIDDDKIVYARGFGFADVERGVKATPQTVYKAGSISKLFTAVAAMQLVEDGKLDLDAPLAKSNPEFKITNPFAGEPPFTLRQLMCHRSGMIREAPVGGYFDDQEPTLKETLASVADCVLVNPPNAKTRYSNVGPTIVGRCVELASGSRFESVTAEKIFDRIDMKQSGWSLDARLKPQMAAGYMRIAQRDGSFVREKAPQFELGTVPAGNLYSTVEDLGRFVTFLLNEGGRGDVRLLKAESLAEMFRPQLTKDATGFGLGFSVNKFREHTTVQHMGAVYGFTTSLVAIPGKKVGAVVLSNEDIAIGSVQRVMAAALGAVLEGKHGEKPPETPPPTTVMGPADLAPFLGQFESESFWAEVTAKDGRLHVLVSGQPMTLEPKGELTFRADGRFVFDGAVTFERNDAGTIVGVTMLKQKFARVAATSPAAPELWQKFVGSYGPVFIPLIVSIRHGHLYAMTENEFDYRLTPLNRTVFRLPPGLYDDEHLVFQQDVAGDVHAVILANMKLKRRDQPRP